MVPQTGEVLALYSSPAIDPNRWVGGVSSAYYDSLNNDPRQPLYNKALQGAVSAGLDVQARDLGHRARGQPDHFDTHMPQPCTRLLLLRQSRVALLEEGRARQPDLAGAIAQSCDVYFYQLGQKITLTRLVAGGIALGFDKKTGIDLPEEKTSAISRRAFPDYFNQKYGPRGWTPGAKELNLAIGQGENAQTVINMARFYSALATDGSEPTPMIKRGRRKRDEGDLALRPTSSRSCARR